MSDKKDYEISVCYFPQKGEVGLTYECMTTHKKCFLLLPIDKEQGERLVDVIGPCVYYSAELIPTKKAADEV